MSAGNDGGDVGCQSAFFDIFRAILIGAKWIRFKHFHMEMANIGARK